MIKPSKPPPWEHQMVKRSSPASRRPVEVILACGRRVVVSPGFDPETLLQVVGILEQRGS
jgi:hypothetical protein